MADALDAATADILAANAVDVAAARARAPVTHHRPARSDDGRVAAMAQGLREVAGLPDPVGEVVRGFNQPNGLQISQVRVPFGVLAMVYEARPNVTVDAAGLAIKSGNAALLRGSASAIRLQPGAGRGAVRGRGQGRAAGRQRPAGAGHGSVQRRLPAARPRPGRRGHPARGAGLISYVVENSSVPVIETGIGNVHIYVDASADLEMAERIVLNAKLSRPSVCNAAESLLVHRSVARSSCRGS